MNKYSVIMPMSSMRISIDISIRGKSLQPLPLASAEPLLKRQLLNKEKKQVSLARIEVLNRIIIENII